MSSGSVLSSWVLGQSALGEPIQIPITDWDVRLVAYEPYGPRLGYMPFPLDMSATVPFNDVSSLTVQYSSLTAGGEFLMRGLSQGLEIALETYDNAGWFEPPNSRFILIRRAKELTDLTKNFDLTLPGYGWLMRKARNLNTSALLPSTHSQAGKRAFYSANAGTIIGTLLQENRARGGVPVDVDFTNTVDSAGVLWDKIITIYYELGMDVWTILENLTAQGVVDWRIQGRTLQLYNVDTVLAQDRTLEDPPVRLHLSRDVLEAPDEESIEEVVSSVLIRGDNGLTISEDNVSAPTPWGKWEGFISQGGVSDEGTARTLVQADLSRGSRTRGQYTRGLTFLNTQFYPFVRFSPGDYVIAPTFDETNEKVRVQQITITKGQNGVGGNVILNDRFIEAELRRSRRITGIVGGSTVDGGSGARPAPEVLILPGAPATLSVISDAYIDANGVPQAVATLSWDGVSTGVNPTQPGDSTPSVPSETLSGGPIITVIYAPHPGDEVLFLSGYVQHALARGDQLILVSMTDGEAASLYSGIPVSSGPPPTAYADTVLGAVRLADQEEGWSALTDGNGTIQHLHLPDWLSREADGVNIIKNTAETLNALGPSVEHYACAHPTHTHRDELVLVEGLKAASGLGVVRFSRSVFETGGTKYLPGEERLPALMHAWRAHESAGHKINVKHWEQVLARGFVSWTTP